MSYNVSAVHEPPEPTVRAAQEVPRPSPAAHFIGCVADPRKRAVRNPQRVIRCWISCRDRDLFETAHPLHGIGDPSSRWA